MAAASLAQQPDADQGPPAGMGMMGSGMMGQGMGPGEIMGGGCPMMGMMMGPTRPANPVDRLDLHISTMESRLQALKEVKLALSALHATLSEDQKKSAESLLTGMGCMM